ncbi:MAG: hypothetical protein AVDCRST_MAG24-1550, partial [uncultured Nocardioidaceae bacterium]
DPGDPERVAAVPGRSGRRGRPAHRLVPRGPAAQRGPPAQPGVVPGRQPATAGGISDLAVPRRGSRLALHALRRAGLCALPTGRVGAGLHARHAPLRDRAGAVVLGRAPSDPAGARGLRCTGRVVGSRRGRAQPL